MGRVFKQPSAGIAIGNQATGGDENGALARLRVVENDVGAIAGSCGFKSGVAVAVVQPARWTEGGEPEFVGCEDAFEGEVGGVLEKGGLGQNDASQEH